MKFIFLRSFHSKGSKISQKITQNCSIVAKFSCQYLRLFVKRKEILYFTKLIVTNSTPNCFIFLKNNEKSKLLQEKQLILVQYTFNFYHRYQPLCSKLPLKTTDRSIELYGILPTTQNYMVDYTHKLQIIFRNKQTLIAYMRT